MLVSSKSTVSHATPVQKQPVRRGSRPEPVSFAAATDAASEFVSQPDMQLTRAIGQLNPALNTHFYSFGNFNLVRLIMYLMKQTGPVHLFMSSYSFSSKSIQQLQHNLETNRLLSFRLLIDNRVRSISPKPFQIIASCFNYRCTSVHAKVALLWNEKWQISIVTSQNATDNPKMERGTIFTDPSVFQFDHKNLSDAFNRGTT